MLLNYTDRIDYYPFGLTMPGRSSNSANPNDQYKFTGHEFDDEAGIDLYYMIARGMDPVTGRFMSIDPLADQFPGISPYAYTNNNPLRFTDPTGMAAEEAGGCPPCNFEYFTRSLFQNYDNTYVGDLFRADAQGDGRLEEKVALDAIEVGLVATEGVSITADVVEAGALVAAPFAEGATLPVAVVAGPIGSAADFLNSGLEATKANITNTSFDKASSRFANATAGIFINKTVAGIGQATASKALKHFEGATQAKGAIPFSAKVGNFIDKTIQAASVFSTRLIRPF